jgi:hypothetical protein
MPGTLSEVGEEVDIRKKTAPWAKVQSIRSNLKETTG